MCTSRLRIHEQTRTGSLEQVQNLKPARFMYRTKSYDFDEELADTVGAIHSSRLQAVWEIVRNRPEIVELNEPAMMRAWPSTLLYTIAIRIVNTFSRKPIVIVTYAIENNDVVAAFASYSRLPHGMSKFFVSRIMAFLSSPIQRIAFGSKGSRDLYEALVPKVANREIDTRDFPELARRCSRCDLTKKIQVAFVGNFEHRKGILQLLDAWSHVLASMPDARLVVAGKGSLMPLVSERACDLLNVDVVVDPSRAEIHKILAGAQVLVLFSQPSKRWREQIGRPLMEGLAHGCEIVTSSETGLAEWLEAQDHQVLAADASPEMLAEAVTKSLRTPREPASITSSLPKTDARIQADAWMMQLADC